MDTGALLVLVGESADVPRNVVCDKHDDVMFTTHCVCFRHRMKARQRKAGEEPG